MKTDDILTLAKAGFNAQQISALAAIQATPAPAPAPAPTPAPAQQNTIDDVMKELGLLQSNIQNAAMANVQQPQVETVDDVLASIINPPALENK